MSTALAVLRRKYMHNLLSLLYDSYVYCISGTETLSFIALISSAFDSYVYCISGTETFKFNIQIKKVLKIPMSTALAILRHLLSERF